MRLTPSAYAHGFALALPEKVVLARPQDSNLRPSAPEADALSTELQARGADHTGSGSERAPGFPSELLWVANIASATSLFASCVRDVTSSFGTPCAGGTRPCSG